ncbi:MULTISPECIES: response regulator [unclassified Acidovorax]|uniref:response regulator n=2 Tax=unclassified Acidovorax TaxID=2684926 RepID=UPI002882FA36|nr:MULTISPECIES: response regulator [unclassified Acidovorax]
MLQLAGESTYPLMPLYAILVEDNQTIRDTLMPAMSELAGIQVVAFAETAMDAIKAARDVPHQWSLMVLDLFLRNGSGLDVLKALGPWDPEREVVVLTNFATPDVRERCMTLGAKAVFDKSTELEQFFDYCMYRHGAPG